MRFEGNWSRTSCQNGEQSTWTTRYVLFVNVTEKITAYFHRPGRRRSKPLSAHCGVSPRPLKLLGDAGHRTSYLPTPPITPYSPSLHLLEPPIVCSQTTMVQEKVVEIVLPNLCAMLPRPESSLDQILAHTKHIVRWGS